MTEKSILQEIWPEWIPEEKIGADAYGETYKCVKHGADAPVYAAVRLILVPKNDTAAATLQAAGMDGDAVRTYFRDVVTDCENEIRLLGDLKDEPHIVTVDDWSVRKLEDGFGWIICLRTEMLQSLPTAYAEKAMSEDDVIRMGIDICTALEACHTRHIIHRDIKPSNIFVSPDGGFELGNFSIVRYPEKDDGALWDREDPAYKAPEIEKQNNYDMRVDIYSLGLTMYQLLNHGNPPFTDPYRDGISYDERDAAIRRRMAGEPFPEAADAGSPLTAVLDKACAFIPAKRYGAATIMKQALTALQKGEKKNMDNARYPNASGAPGSEPNNASSRGWDEAERGERRSTVHGGYNAGRNNDPDEQNRTMVAGSGYGSTPLERGGGRQDGPGDWNRNANGNAPYRRGEMPPEVLEPPMPEDGGRQDDYLADLNSQGVNKKKAVTLGVVAAILILGLAAVSVILGIQLKDEKDKNDDNTEFCILSQPESIKTVDGETVEFVVEAKGDQLSYQWEQKDGGSWKKIKEDGDGRVLELEASDDLDEKEYRCKITNEKEDDDDDDDGDDGDKETIYSKTVKLTLGEGIKVIEQPKDATAVLGEEVAFSVAAQLDDDDSDEDDISYQWEKLVDGAWESLGNGYDEATFTFTPKERHNGAEYRCRVTSPDKVVVFSDAATVTVEP